MTIPPDYPWRPGMLAFNPYNGMLYRLVRDVDGKGWWAVMTETTTEQRGRLGDCVPDLTDGPTKGALLEAVREAYVEPTLMPFAVVGGFIITRLVDGMDGRWSHDTLSLAGSWIEDDADDERMPIRLPTEAAALLAAWEARPR